MSRYLFQRSKTPRLLPVLNFTGGNATTEDEPLGSHRLRTDL